MRKNDFHCVKKSLMFAISRFMKFEFCNFADMNSAQFYPLLLCLASGITMCLLVALGIYLLRRNNNYQFQRAFAVAMLMQSIGFLNNFIVLAFSDEDTAVFINMLLILYDYVVVGGYMIFVVTLVFPGRFSALRLSLFEIPYLLAIIMYAITRSPIVYPSVQIYTFVASTVLLIWGGILHKEVQQDASRQCRRHRTSES